MEHTRRVVAVVTGSRADYGLLRFVLEDLRTDARIALRLIVTGSHLSTEFGLSFHEIEADGFAADAAVHMLIASDAREAVAKSLGLGVLGFVDALDRLRPAIVVVLGDRFEVLAAAQAAMMMGIPIAHVHGGEVSEGAIDESIRHAITKMAHLHFTAAEPYRRRVLQLGENPKHVYQFGAPGLDAMRRTELPGREALEAEIGVRLIDPVFVITYHPATASTTSPSMGIRALLDALEHFPEATLVLTKSNADAGGRAIGQALEAWGRVRGGRTVVRDSLGRTRYLGLLRYAAAVIGNSSSGLIEAPAARVPTVNVGERQTGRLKAASVIDCADDALAIRAAIERACAPEHRVVTDAMTPPYGFGGDASRRIADVLASAPLDGILSKRFYDHSPEDEHP